MSACVVSLLALLLLGGCAALPFTEDATAKKATAPRIKLDITGATARLAKNIRAQVSLAGKPCDLAPAYLGALAGRAHDEVLAALRAFGYYQARATVVLARADACPLARITVERGARVRVQAVDVAVSGVAHDDEGFMQALTRLPLVPGQGLNHERYTASKRRIESLALERGYLDGRFTRSRLLVDPGSLTAVADLAWDSGSRYTIGDLRITQQSAAIDEALIRRFFDYSPGQAYDARLIGDFYDALTTSEYFNAIEIRPLLSAPEEGAIPIAVELTPRKRHKYTTGLGLSTDEGVRSRLRYANRRLNRHGHRIGADLRGSLIEQRVSAEYRIPRAHPADEWLSVQAGVRHETVETYDTVEAQLGIAETHRRPWGWMETRFVQISRQYFDISSGNEESTLVIPGLRWEKSVSNDPLYPTTGYSVDVEVRGSADALVSSVDFIRALASARTVHVLWPRSRVLLRGDLGASWIATFDQLPPSERFFAGGDVSIRGFDFQALGPEDARGEVIGGQYLGVASVELEQSLNARWGVAGFVDAGNAFGGDGGATGIRMGVGVGLRWRSPVGPARVDLAHPLDDDTLVRVHIRIGPDF